MVFTNYISFIEYVSFTGHANSIDIGTKIEFFLVLLLVPIAKVEGK